MIPRAGQSFVSNVFGSNMVLQRAPYQAQIWGWTSQPNAAVALKFNSQTYKATSGKDNSWSIYLNPQAAGGPYNITITSTAGDNAVLTNVLFGDVWVCSGQSNMQFTVSSAFNSTAEIAAANRYPNIRLFTVGQANVSNVPLAELSNIEQTWVPASSTSVGGGDWSYFSASCWFFGRDLYDTYGVPLGLISSNWGGTYIQAWSSPTALSQCNQTSDEEVRKIESPNPNQPSVLWNAMIVPFLPMKVAGAIWYQAEANVGADKYYACAFPAMIQDWNLNFNNENEDFGFFFVQLAAYTEGNPGDALALMRLAQTSALQLEYVGMATAFDLGDPATNNPYGNIHPRDKQPVGYRLSLAAQNLYYGDEAVEYLGPTFFQYQVVKNAPNVVVWVQFELGSLDDGLVMQEAYCPEAVGISNCAWAEILTSDGNWNNATQSISEENFQLEVTVAAGLTVQGVRYGFAEWPVATLYNTAGLPAPPFFATSSDMKNKF